MYHNWLIHAFVDGHVDCFYFGTYNNAGMMFTYRSLCRYVFHFSQVSRSGLARSYGKCVFNFKRKFWHVSKVAVQFYIPTNRLQSYFPFTSSRGCVLVSHCTLICVSLMTHEVRQLFMCLLAIGIDSCEVLIFFTELSCFSYWCVRVFIYSVYTFFIL